MREIKFRYTCKRENGHVFHKDFTLEEIEYGKAEQWITVNSIRPDTLYRRQYIGQKDIALKEEYDGDLIRDTEGTIWRISTDDPRGTTHIDIKTGEIVTTWDFLRPHVIIGNICETPELLIK